MVLDKLAEDNIVVIHEVPSNKGQVPPVVHPGPGYHELPVRNVAPEISFHQDVTCANC